MILTAHKPVYSGGLKYILQNNRNLLIICRPNKRFSLTGTTHDSRSSPTSSLISETDEKRQRFCIATHPTKPIILCSDGYLATIMELPESLTCTSLMTGFLSEGRNALNKLSEERQLGLSRLQTLQVKQTSQLNQSLHPSQLGETQGNATSKGLINTVGSDTGYTGPYSNLDEGKIVFGYPMELEATQKSSPVDDGVSAVASHAQRALFRTLGLGLSHPGTWTTNLDQLLLLTARSIIRLCEVMLLNSSPQTTLGILNRRDKEQVLHRVCNLFQGGMTTFLWDMNYQNSQSTVLKMAYWMVKALLRHAKTLPSWLAPKSCATILQFSERLVSTIYTMVPVQQPSLHFNDLSFHQGNLFSSSLYFNVLANFAAVSFSIVSVLSRFYTSVKTQSTKCEMLLQWKRDFENSQTKVHPLSSQFARIKFHCNTYIYCRKQGVKLILIS